MYKLIIADDEKIIREGLKRFVLKNTTDFELAGCFADGKYVIEYLQEHPADVVITDIRMSNVSGIDVAKYIYDNGLKTKVVILSGYKEFEYAMKSIEYNVETYLLKPTDFEKFRDVLSKLKQDLGAEKELERQQSHYQEILPILTEEFFTDVVMGAVKDREEILNRTQFLALDIHLDTAPCALFAMKMLNYKAFISETWQHGKDRLHNMIKNVVQNGDTRGNFYQIFYRNDTLAMLCISDKFPSTELFFEYLKEKLQCAAAYLESNFHLSLDIRQICLCETIFDLTNQKLSLARYGSVFDEGDEHNWLDEQIRLLATYIRSGHCQEACNIFERYIGDLKGQPLDQVKQKITGVFHSIYAILAETIPKFQYAKKGKLDYEAIMELKSYEAIRTFGNQLLFGLSKYVEQHHIDSADVIIRNAKKYINDNYQHDISLQDVADQVFLSQKYFSKIFKEKTGENYLDYVIKIRMEHAIKFLAAGYKVEQISKMAGYGSSRYFTRRFKQYTGFTPKEYYRRVIKGGNGED
mgnify:FL=1